VSTATHALLVERCRLITGEVQGSARTTTTYATGDPACRVSRPRAPGAAADSDARAGHAGEQGTRRYVVAGGGNGISKSGSFSGEVALDAGRHYSEPRVSDRLHANGRRLESSRARL